MWEIINAFVFFGSYLSRNNKGKCFYFTVKAIHHDWWVTLAFFFFFLLLIIISLYSLGALSYSSNTDDRNHLFSLHYKPGTAWGNLHIFLFSVLAATLDIIIMTLHNRKLSHREVKKIVRGHLALYCLRSMAIKITCSLILKVFSLLNVCWPCTLKHIT